MFYKTVLYMQNTENDTECGQPLEGRRGIQFGILEDRNPGCLIFDHHNHKLNPEILLRKATQMNLDYYNIKKAV